MIKTFLTKKEKRFQKYKLLCKNIYKIKEVTDRIKPRINNL